MDKCASPTDMPESSGFGGAYPLELLDAPGAVMYPEAFIGRFVSSRLPTSREMSEYLAVAELEFECPYKVEGNVDPREVLVLPALMKVVVTALGMIICWWEVCGCCCC